jgi:hypothetical protein
VALDKKNLDALLRAADSLKNKKRVDFGNDVGKKADIDLFKSSERAAYSNAKNNPDIIDPKFTAQQRERGFVMDAKDYPMVKSNADNTRTMEFNRGSRMYDPKIDGRLPSPQQYTNKYGIPEPVRGYTPEWGGVGESPINVDPRGKQYISDKFVNNGARLANAAGLVAASGAADIGGLNEGEDALIARQNEANAANDPRMQALARQNRIDLNINNYESIPYAPGVHPNDIQGTVANNLNAMKAAQAQDAIERVAVGEVLKKQAPEINNVSVSELQKIAETLATQNPSDEDVAAKQEDLLTRTKQQIADMSLGREEKKTASSNFLDALTYFAPTIAAGLIGNAIGGAEAGYGAAKAATDLNKGYLDYKAGQDKLSGGMSDKDRATLTARMYEANIANESLGVRKDNTESLVKNRQTLAELGRDRLDLKKAQGDRTLDLKQERLELDKVGKGSLSDSQVKEFSEAKDSIMEVGGLLNDVNSDPKMNNIMGNANGRKQAFNAMFNKADPAYVKAAANLARFTSNEYHKRFGAAISESEMKTLTDALPKLTDSVESFNNKMNQFHRDLKEKLKNRVDTISGGQRLKKDAAERAASIPETKAKPTREQVLQEIARRKGLK